MRVGRPGHIMVENTQSRLQSEIQLCTRSLVCMKIHEFYYIREDVSGQGRGFAMQMYSVGMRSKSSNIMPTAVLYVQFLDSIGVAPTRITAGYGLQKFATNSA